MQLANARDLEVLTFRLHGELFAVEAHSVREILDLVGVTEVPNSRPFVNALINVRGKVVPLADLRVKFGLEALAPTIDTRVIVLDLPVDGEPTTVGILADKVHEVTDIASAAMEETPRIGLRWRREYIACIGKTDESFVIVLDMPRIFSSAGNETGAFPAPAEVH